MYSERLLEHFRSPRFVGELEPPALSVEVMNPVCGDILRLSARMEGHTVVEARYKTRGCTASIAAGEALCGWMQGRSTVELAQLTAADVEAQVGGLAPESRHAAVLCVDGVKALLRGLGIRG